jgi:enterochelin esterase family protein
MKLGAALSAIIIIASGLVGTAHAAGKLLTGLEVPSPVLGHPIHYNLYLPYDPMPAGETFPVAYLLHGWGGDADQWWQGGPLVEMFDTAIAAGEMRPMIVVTPSGEDSWYVDNPAPTGKGNYATAFTTDLITAIDATYPTQACREGRIIGGYSMGGVGATVIGLMHPELYAGVISLAGRFPPLLDNPTPEDLVQYRGDFAGAFGDPLDPALFNAWNALSLVDAASRAPRKPRFYFVTGDNDDPDMVEGAAIVYDRLSVKGFYADFRVVEGYHNSDVWNPGVMDALKSFAKSLPKGCRKP